MSCTPTDGVSTTTRLFLIATAPSGVFYNTRGTNPWLQDGASGTSGTQFLASTALSGTQVVAGNNVAVGHFLSQWSSPTLVVGSDGNSFSFDYVFGITAVATMPTGVHRCDIEGVLVPAS